MAVSWWLTRVDDVSEKIIQFGATFESVLNKDLDTDSVSHYVLLILAATRQAPSTHDIIYYNIYTIHIYSIHYCLPSHLICIEVQTFSATKILSQFRRNSNPAFIRIFSLITNDCHESAKYTLVIKMIAGCTKYIYHRRIIFQICWLHNHMD